MKKIKQLLAIVATAAVTLLPGGKTLAQTQGGVDVQNMNQQDFENAARQAGSSPEQQQAAMEQFQKMSPEQQQTAIARFQTLDPQLQQNVMQQVQNVAPQMQQDAMQPLQGNDPQPFQGMDPQRIQNAMQQRINASLREQMGITNDTEWALIEAKINAVRKAQMASLADSGVFEMMGMNGMGGGRPGGGGFLAMLGQPSPESDALRQALESDAPRTQLKTLAAKLQAVRKEKLATLVRAQEQLRVLLTTRQEAIATIAGLFN